MWAQIITSRLKPGREADLDKLTAQLKAAEQANFRSRACDGGEG